MPRGFNNLLSGKVVLDLTNEKGLLAGRMLADLGADVIKIEPPEGCPARNKGPFYHDITHPEKSLFWAFFNTNKRSITLDLSCEKARELFKKLVQKADIMIESFPPGEMEELNLGYDELATVNPGIIYTSITPFGRTGPYRDYQVTDLIAMAMGGVVYLAGYEDRPPVRIGYPQAYLNASAVAAVASLVALYHREMTGEGQLVDVSIQESLLRATFNSTLAWHLEGYLFTRLGTTRIMGPKLRAPIVWSCKDGYVSFITFGGAVGGEAMRSLGEWLVEEGIEDKTTSEIDWASFSGIDKLTTETLERASKPIKRLFARYTKKELLEECLRRRILLLPVSTSADILDEPHLASKEFWQTVEYPELEDSIVHPKPPFQIDGVYPPIVRKSPLIGEHNVEVYESLLGLSHEEIVLLKEEGIT